MTAKRFPFVSMAAAIVAAALCVLWPAANAPAVAITTFTGAGGANFSGTFPVAVKLGNWGDQHIGDVTFAHDFRDIVTYTGTSYTGADPTFGTVSPDDAALRSLCNGGLYSGSGFTVTLPSLAAGTYKIQLFFVEQYNADRVFSIDFGNDGSSEVASMDPLALSGNLVAGTLVTQQVTLPTGPYTIAVTNISGPGPFLNALTVESVPEPATLALLALGGLGTLARRKRANRHRSKPHDER